MTLNKTKEERRTEIISAAVEVFVEKGYEGTSMDLIAKRAGLSKGGLYHHFKSKDDILIEANNEYMKPVYEMIEETLTMENPAQGLEFYIKSYLKYWNSHERELVFVLLSMTKVLQVKEMWSLYDDTYAKEMISFLESLFIKGIETGIFRPHDTKCRTITLFGALDGIIAYLIMCKSLPFKDTVGNFINLYVKEIMK